MRRLADFIRTAAWRAARQGGLWAAALACALAIAACSGDAPDEPELSTFTGEPISATPQAAADAQDAGAADGSELSAFTGEPVSATSQAAADAQDADAADADSPLSAALAYLPSISALGEPTSATPQAAIDAPAAADIPPPAALASLPSISTLVDDIEDAVVSISVEAVSRGMFVDFNDEGAGTGMVIRPDGYIVTNYHVIQGAHEIKINLWNGDVYDAAVVGYDRITDLAVLKIDAENLPTIKMGDSDVINVGDWVVALGNALALKGGPTVTLGIVSARDRTVSTERGELYGLIQTDAAINDGNSGGPLINLRGEVVGINTAILRRAQGIGFAVGSSAAQPIIDTLIEDGRVVRPLIGLTGADVTPARANQLGLTVREGIIVTRMTEDGPAHSAGIRPGNVITKLNAIPTPDMANFLSLLWTFDVGQQIQVEYITGGETHITTVTLVERPGG